jgi:hypothetical protein
LKVIAPEADPITDSFGEAAAKLGVQIGVDVPANILRILAVRATQLSPSVW